MFIKFATVIKSVYTLLIMKKIFILLIPLLFFGVGCQQRNVSQPDIQNKSIQELMDECRKQTDLLGNHGIPSNDGKCHFLD